MFITVARRWYGWLAVGGLGALLLVSSVLGFAASGPLANPSDLAPHAALTALASVSTEIAPAVRVGTPRVVSHPRLQPDWLALVVALVGGLLAVQPLTSSNSASRFPPGRRGRARLYAYLN